MRQVAIMFMLSVVMVILFIVAFIAIPRDAVITLPYIGAISAFERCAGRHLRAGDLPIGPAPSTGPKKP